MQTVSIGENRVRIRPNAVMWMISGLLVLFFCLVAGTWVLDRLDGETHLPDPLVLCLCLAVLALALFLFLYVRGRSLTVDETGVEWRVLFRKRHLIWTEIRDYGLSYVRWGSVRLYFSPEVLPTNGKGRKRLSGMDASGLLHIQNRERSGQILNVCRKFTRVRPFLCSDEGRLEGVLRDR